MSNRTPTAEELIREGQLANSMETTCPLSDWLAQLLADALAEIERLRELNADQARFASNAKVDELRQRAEALEHKLSTAEVAEKMWREDHQRAIAKLAEAQQREALWKEWSEIQYMRGYSGGYDHLESQSTFTLARVKELRYRLGLDDAT